MDPSGVYFFFTKVCQILVTTLERDPVLTPNSF